MDFGLVRWYLEEMVAGPLKGCRRRLQMRWLRSDLFKRPRYRVTPKFVGGKEGSLEFHVKKTAEFQKKRAREFLKMFEMFQFFSKNWRKISFFCDF